MFVFAAVEFIFLFSDPNLKTRGFIDPFSCHNELCNIDHPVAKLGRGLIVVIVELLPDLLVEELSADRERVLKDPQDDVGAVCLQSLANGEVSSLTGISPGTVEDLVDDL